MVSLHEEQGYVSKGIEALGLDARLVLHDSITESCNEKASLLGWPEEHIVKALYFEGDSHVIGIITPEFGRVPIKEIVSSVFGLSGSKAKKYRMSSPPTGMVYGTCTPFPRFSVVGSEVSDLVVCNLSAEEHFVDVSVGGEDELAKRTSLHLPYWGISAILKEAFQDRVHEYKVD